MLPRLRTQGPPNGQAAREPRDPDAASEPVGQVGGRGLPGHVRVRREDDLLDAVPSTRPISSSIRRSRGSTPSIGDSAPPRTWYSPRYSCVRSRRRGRRAARQADEGTVAPVAAYPAAVFLGEVAALRQKRTRSLTSSIAVASASASSLARGAGGTRAGGRCVPDAWEARQLRDEVIDGGGEHGRFMRAFGLPSFRAAWKRLRLAELRERWGLPRIPFDRLRPNQPEPEILGPVPTAHDARPRGG